MPSEFLPICLQLDISPPSWSLKKKRPLTNLIFYWGPGGPSKFRPTVGILVDSLSLALPLRLGQNLLFLGSLPYFWGSGPSFLDFWPYQNLYSSFPSPWEASGFFWIPIHCSLCLSMNSPISKCKLRLTGVFFCPLAYSWIHLIYQTNTFSPMGTTQSCWSKPPPPTQLPYSTFMWHFLAVSNVM